MKAKKPPEPIEPEKETYLGTRPYSSLSMEEKRGLWAATRALLSVIWEHRAEIDPAYAEYPDDILPGILTPNPSGKPK